MQEESQEEFVNTTDILYINEIYIYNNTGAYPDEPEYVMDASYRLYYRMRRGHIKEIKVTKKVAQ